MEERRDESGTLDSAARQDMDEGTHVGFVEADASDPGEAALIELHRRQHAHDRAHVDLRQEEYSPEEVSRLMGTSLDVVMHAIWGGDLKAQRQGHNVICIQHADLTDWLRRRAAE